MWLDEMSDKLSTSHFANDDSQDYIGKMPLITCVITINLNIRLYTSYHQYNQMIQLSLWDVIRLFDQSQLQLSRDRGQIG